MHDGTREDAGGSFDVPAEGLTRRTLVSRGAQGAALIGSVGLLSACGSGERGGAGPGTTEAAPGPATSSGGGTPTRGGTLRVGLSTGGANETLNPNFGYNAPDFYRLYALYDSLFLMGPDYKTAEPRLALSAEPNKDASIWTIKLRDGVTWHDGKPFTADDVIYTMRTWTQPGSSNTGVVQYIDTKNLRKRGTLELEVPLLRPIGQFREFLINTSMTSIVQDGSTPESFANNPVGTGPFKFVSFKANRSEFAASENYWESGKPYLDELVMDSSFTDDNARLNALLSGNIEVMTLSPPTVTHNHMNSGDVMAVGSPSSFISALMVMRVDQGPLADVRVRQAMKLLADRQALIDDALAGFGTIGNDLYGAGVKYAADLKRERDVEKATALLKAAGKDGSTFTLGTAPFSQGAVESATLFAQQARAGGIKVEINQASPAAYFTPAGGYLTGSFRMTAANPRPTLAAIYATIFGPQAYANESHWGKQPGGKAKWALIDQAISAVDESKAEELWREVQMQQFDEGGILNWGNANFLNLVSKKVKGVTESRAGFLNNGRFTDAFLA